MRDVRTCSEHEDVFRLAQLIANRIWWKVMEMKSLIVANLIYAVIYDKFENLKLKFYKQKFALKIK